MEEGDESLVLPGAVLATIGIFNNRDDIDALIAAVQTLAVESHTVDRKRFDAANQC